MASNELLKKANQAKKDEFYTQLTDIDKELSYYIEHFKDKVVFCNCDDPYESNFVKFFTLNFNRLGLRKLICTCYAGSPVVSTQLSLFDVEGIIIKKEYPNPPYKIEITEVDDFDGDGTINLNDIEYLLKNKKNTLTLLKGDGDFRSKECVELLKEADIVVTNPPFSLFREYVAQLIEYDKKFLIIGNQNAVTYKEIFPLIKDNKMWFGLTMNGSNRYFRVPDYYPLTEKTGKIENGKKYAFVKGVRWFTNLEVPKRHEKMILYKRYTPEEYPEYINYDAINIDKTTDIPCDYDELMGVPITFLDKYNPEQFKIIDLGIVGSCEFKNNKRMEILDKFGNPTGKFTYNAKGTLYRKFDPQKDKVAAFKDVDTGELYSSIYARIIIKRIDNSSEGEVYEDKVA